MIIDQVELDYKYTFISLCFQTHFSNRVYMLKYSYVYITLCICFLCNTINVKIKKYYTYLNLKYLRLTFISTSEGRHNKPSSYSGPVHICI